MKKHTITNLKTQMYGYIMDVNGGFPLVIEKMNYKLCFEIHKSLKLSDVRRIKHLFPQINVPEVV